jgi:hypothetical protein
VAEQLLAVCKDTIRLLCIAALQLVAPVLIMLSLAFAYKRLAGLDVGVCSAYESVRPVPVRLGEPWCRDGGSAVIVEGTGSGGCLGVLDALQGRAETRVARLRHADGDGWPE